MDYISGITLPKDFYENYQASCISETSGEPTTASNNLKDEFIAGRFAVKKEIVEKLIKTYCTHGVNITNSCKPTNKDKKIISGQGIVAKRHKFFENLSKQATTASSVDLKPECSKPIYVEYEGCLPTCTEYIFLGEETRENLLFYEEKSYQEELMKIKSGELNQDLYTWIFSKICLFSPGV